MDELGVWTPSEGPVQQFLDRFKPSTNEPPTVDAQPIPWYWIRKPASPGSVSPDTVQFCEEGRKYVDILTNTCARILASEPKLANARLGVPGHKKLFELTHTRFNQKITKLAKKHRVLSGKWLFFSSREEIDNIWSRIALSFESGALSALEGCKTAKVATSNGGIGPYVICVYCEDSWNKEAVGNVFRALVTDCELVSKAYKVDALTLLDIDSKHPSKLKTSLYGQNEFMTKADVDEHFASVKRKREAKNGIAKQLPGDETKGPVYASDSEEEVSPTKKKKIKVDE